MMTSTKYMTIETTTLGGIKRIEALLANGWQIIRNGMFSVTLRKVSQ